MRGQFPPDRLVLSIKDVVVQPQCMDIRQTTLFHTVLGLPWQFCLVTCLRNSVLGNLLSGCHPANMSKPSKRLVSQLRVNKKSATMQGNPLVGHMIFQ